MTWDVRVTQHTVSCFCFALFSLYFEDFRFSSSEWICSFLWINARYWQDWKRMSHSVQITMIEPVIHWTEFLNVGSWFFTIPQRRTADPRPPIQGGGREGGRWESGWRPGREPKVLAGQDWVVPLSTKIPRKRAFYCDIFCYIVMFLPFLYTPTFRRRLRHSCGYRIGL